LVRHAVGARETIVVAMDWTDFDADDQTTLALHVVTGHGRATPLLWLTVGKGELKDTRNDFEDLCLSRLKACLPTTSPSRSWPTGGSRRQTVRLSGEPRLRLRHSISRNIQVAAENARRGSRGLGRQRRSGAHAARGGNHRGSQPGPAVVCVHAKDMKEPWCIATSLRDATARDIVDHYAKRWTIEPSFRDAKDLRFAWHERIADLRSTEA